MYMQSSSGETPVSDAGLSAAWSRVAAFASAVDADLDRWLADAYRVGLTEFRALALLGQATDKELRVNDLAQRVGLSQSSVTRLVSRLEAKGLARRDLCPDDGRGVYAVLSGEGETLLREVREPYERRVRELLSQASGHFPHLDLGQLGLALGAVRALVAD
ncbi:MarR family winged helix-turn-helix transcriptional regulator [Plantactinospora sp. GCM10030261]|uniref:MarR family winged helix-turn-helix transcriptional regulator n=1 Tax=Plantactinospora sp. GCM10030261 TaxID=3273420 RepID=UPI00360675CA